MKIDKSKIIGGGANKKAPLEKPKADNTQINSIISRPQYKQKKYAHEQGRDRYFKISKCEDCGGNPTKVDFEVSGIKGKRCNECFQVTDYEL